MNIIPFPSRFISQFTLVIDWELRKLGENADIKTGPFGSTLHAKDYIEAGMPIITTEHFKQGQLPKTKRDIPQVSDIDYLRLKSYKLQEGDIVFSRVGSVDINALVTSWQDGWLFSGRVLRVRPQKQFHSDYLHFLLDTRTVRNDVISRAVGQTMPSINTKILKETKVITSNNIDEQKQIASFLRNIDETIILHQRKLDALKHLKEAYLQSMFPKNRESIPKLRFANFEENWEQRKIKAFSKNSFGGGTPKTSNKNYWDGEIPWIQSSDLLEHQVSKVSPKKKITKDGLKNSAAKLIPEDSIAIVTRVGVGKIALMDILYTTSQDFLSLSNLNVNKWFGVYSLYNHLQKEIHKVQGTSIKGITKSDLLTQKVCVPIEHAEQEKVGYFFKKIDDMISLQQQKLKQLQNLKKAYLQKMFI